MWNESNVTCHISDFSMNMIMQVEERSNQLPYIIVGIILSAFGVLANLQVIIALWGFLEDKNLTFTIYLKTISVSDMFSCFGMFAKVFAEHYVCPQVDDRDNICNITNFLGYFSCMISMWLVVAISYDRYRHICKPLQTQHSGKKTWIICGLAAVFALILSFPVLFLYGNRSVLIDGVVNVIECGISDSVRYTKFPLIFYIFLDVSYLFLPLSVTIMYWKIRKTALAGIENRRQLDIAGRLAAMRFQTTSSSSKSYENEGQVPHIDVQPKQEKTTNLTRIPVLIAIFFSLSYATILAIKTSKALSGNDKNLSRTVFMIYRYVPFAVYLNNIINPFIYVFNHTKLRSAILKMYTKSCKKT